MNFQKIKSELGKLTKEMIPVILGILVALGINNWNQNRINKAFLKHVFLSIQEEHNENIKELQDIIPSHESLVDTIYQYLNDENVAIGEFPNMVGGLPIALIGNTSWNAFINAQIQLVDFKVVKTLSSIDSYNYGYQTQTKHLSDFFFKNLKSTLSEDKELFASLIEDLTTLEEDILKEHLDLKNLLEN